MSRALGLSIRRTTRRFGPMVAATASAQAMSAVALIVVALTLTPARSDTYVFGLQLATAPISAVVLGVVYNATVGRRGFERWWRFSAGTGVFGVAVAAVVIAVSSFGAMSGRSFDEPGSLAIIAILATGGLVLASLGVFAVRDALLGNPLGLATLSLPSNIAMAATCGVLAALGATETLSVLPAVAWSSVAILQGALTVFRSYRRNGRPKAQLPVMDHDSMPMHLLALGLGAVSASVFPALYVAAAGQLSPGTATVVFIAGRLGAAGIGLFVNALLTVQYRWSESRPTYARQIAVVASAVAIPAGIGSFAWHAAAGDGPGSYILTAIFLFALLTASAVALRELNARVSVRAIGLKSIIDIAVSTGVVIAYSANPSITGYFGAIAVSQSVTLIVASFALKSKSLCLLSLSSIFLATAFVLMGW